MGGQWSNKTHIYDYIRGEGWVNPKTGTFSQGWFYRTFKVAGDKATQADVDKYIELMGLIQGDESDEKAFGELSEKKKKIELENEKLKLEIEKRQIELDVMQGKYIERTEVYLEFAGRITVLDVGLRGNYKAIAAQIIKIVGGKPSKQTELLTLLNKKLDAQMNRFADMKSFKFRIEK